VLGAERSPVGAKVGVVPETVGDGELAGFGLATPVYIFEGARASGDELWRARYSRCFRFGDDGGEELRLHHGHNEVACSILDVLAGGING
jgi:hypothetical protein